MGTCGASDRQRAAHGDGARQHGDGARKHGDGLRDCAHVDCACVDCARVDCACVQSMEMRSGCSLYHAVPLRCWTATCTMEGCSRTAAGPHLSRGAATCSRTAAGPHLSRTVSRRARCGAARRGSLGISTLAHASSWRVRNRGLIRRLWGVRAVCEARATYCVAPEVVRRGTEVL